MRNNNGILRATCVCCVVVDVCSFIFCVRSHSEINKDLLSYYILLSPNNLSRTSYLDIHVALQTIVRAAERRQLRHRLRTQPRRPLAAQRQPPSPAPAPHIRHIGSAPGAWPIANGGRRWTHPKTAVPRLHERLHVTGAGRRRGRSARRHPGCRRSVLHTTGGCAAGRAAGPAHRLRRVRRRLVSSRV